MSRNICHLYILLVGSSVYVSVIRPSKRNPVFTVNFFGKRYEGARKKNKHIEKWKQNPCLFFLKCEKMSEVTVNAKFLLDSLTALFCLHLLPHTIPKIRNKYIIQTTKGCFKRCLICRLLSNTLTLSLCLGDLQWKWLIRWEDCTIKVLLHHLWQ